MAGKHLVTSHKPVGKSFEEPKDSLDCIKSFTHYLEVEGTDNVHRKMREFAVIVTDENVEIYDEALETLIAYINYIEQFQLGNGVGINLKAIEADFIRSTFTQIKRVL